MLSSIMTAKPSFLQQDHVEILEKLDLLQAKLRVGETAVPAANPIHRQLHDDVGICLLKLGRFVIVRCAHASLLLVTVARSCSLVVHDCAERWESRFISINIVFVKVLLFSVNIFLMRCLLIVIHNLGRVRSLV